MHRPPGDVDSGSLVKNISGSCSCGAASAGKGAFVARQHVMTAAREKRRMDDDDDGDDPISRVRSKMSELIEELPSLNIICR